MADRTRLPTRRALRALMLEAMAKTLFNDATDGAGYLYDRADDMGADDMEVYRTRVEAVAGELVAEFERRAERLRR